MGSLRSALDEMTSEDVRGLTDGELAERVVEIERTERVLEAARAAAVAEVEARRAYAADGFLSATAWLARRCGIPGSSAAGQVRLARGLRRMGRDARRAFRRIHLRTIRAPAGRDARGRSRRLLAVRGGAPRAGTLAIRELRRAVEHWHLLVDNDAGDDAACRRFERRGLFVSATIDGMARFDGYLDPETGQTVITALRSVVDAAARGTDNVDCTPAQRRADALGEICRAYLDSTDRPVIAGERPHLVVTVDLATLERGAGRAHTECMGSLSAEDARRIACDAAIARVITHGPSEPLEVGRQTPVVGAGIRRALVVRDAGCRFPGCDRPPGWSDAHHVVHWADGGPTSLSNLVLLCRRHHRAVHERSGSG